MHGYQDKIWIMAPQGTWKDGANVAHNNSNALVVKSALDSASLTWSCPHALFNGAAAEVALTGDATPIEISGTGATSVDDKLVLTMGSNIAISFPIGVKSMKRRTVKVIVYPIKRFPESTDPITPPKAEIEAELNRVFGKQVNAYFSVQIKERLIYDYDVLPTGVNQTSVADNALSNALEGHYLFDKCPKEDHDIIVAILNDGKIETGSDSTAGGHYVGSNDCVVVAENHTTIPRTRAQVLRTLSHEIGHVMIDVPEETGHPNETPGGCAPIKGTDVSQRLMCAGYVRKPEGVLLVKAEWEQVQAGTRSFSFEGQGVEYRFKKDGTWITTPLTNKAMPVDDKSSAAGLPEQSALKNRRPWYWLIGIVLITATGLPWQKRKSALG